MVTIDIEMPANCGECPYKRIQIDRGEVSTYCNMLYDEPIPQECNRHGRAEYCPLKSPEIEMVDRAIDISQTIRQIMDGYQEQLRKLEEAQQELLLLYK